jgi:hypothetical protein
LLHGGTIFRRQEQEAATVTKKDLLGGATGIIGFVADVITVYDKIHGQSPTQPEFSATWISIFVLLTIYCWFILSWVLARWVYSSETQARGRRRRLKLNSLATRSVFALGALFFPLVATVAYSVASTYEPDFIPRLWWGIGGSAYAMAIVGLVMFLALTQGMPLIYDDMR